jgi:hypothetical protein
MAEFLKLAKDVYAFLQQHLIWYSSAAVMTLLHGIATEAELRWAGRQQLNPPSQTVWPLAAQLALRWRSGGFKMAWGWPWGGFGVALGWL